MRKSIKILGKTIPIWIIATFALVGIASAALLTEYASLTANITVAQSINLVSCYYYSTGWQSVASSSNSCSFTASSVGGNSLDVLVQTSNDASVTILVNIVSSSPYSSEYTVTYMYAHDANGCTGGTFTNPFPIVASSTQDFCLRYTFLPNAVGTYPITETVSP